MVINAPICHEWFMDKFAGGVDFNKLIGVFINVINIALRFILISLVKYIG